MRFLLVCLLCLASAPAFAQLPPNGARSTMLLYKNNSLQAVTFAAWWKTIGDNNGAATAASQNQSARNIGFAAQCLGQADIEEANADALQVQATNLEQSADLLSSNGQFYPATAMYGRATAVWIQVERTRGKVNALHEGARYWYEKVGP